jgi:hypothetical protein
MESESYIDAKCFVENEFYDWLGHNGMDAIRMYKEKNIDMINRIYKKCLDLAIIRGYYNQDYENDYRIQDAIDILKKWYGMVVTKNPRLF